MKKILVVSIAASAVFAVSACSKQTNLRELVGVGSTEEQVFAPNARLAVPPDYTLRPPKPGSGTAAKRAAATRGRQALIGDKATGTYVPGTFSQGGRSKGETVLVKKASGGQGVERGIKKKVDAETEASKKGEKAFADKLLKWKKSGDVEPPQPAPVTKKKGSFF